MVERRADTKMNLDVNYSNRPERDFQRSSRTASRIRFLSDAECAAEVQKPEHIAAAKRELAAKRERWLSADLDRAAHSAAASDRDAVEAVADRLAAEIVASEFTDANGCLTLRHHWWRATDWKPRGPQFEALVHGRWIDFTADVGSLAEWHASRSFDAGVEADDVIFALLGLIDEDANDRRAVAAPGDPHWRFETGNWKCVRDDATPPAQRLLECDDPVARVGAFLAAINGAAIERSLILVGEDFYERGEDHYRCVTAAAKSALMQFLDRQREFVSAPAEDETDTPTTLMLPALSVDEAMCAMRYLMAGDELDPSLSIVPEEAFNPAAKRVRGLTYYRASDIQPRAVDWLWPQRIAIGKITGIAGAPDEGKSQIACHLAAVVTNPAMQWPDGGERPPHGKAVILSAEDEIADTIAPRLIAAGADVSKCLALEALVQGKNGKRTLNLADDLERLSALIAQEPDVRLVTIDPISAYLGSKADSYRNTEMRAVLAPLGEWASRHRVAVVFVTHFNKNGKGNALGRVTDSLAFTALARSFWLVVPEQDSAGSKTGRKLFVKGKQNIGKDPGGLAYRIEGATLPNGVPTSRIVWDGTVDITADQALAEAQPRKPSPHLRAAEAFLADALALGAVSVAQLEADAKAAGHSWATIRRAKETLQVQSAKDGVTGWVWSLPLLQ